MFGFELNLPTRLVFGWGLLDTVGKLSRGFGKRCLIMTNQGFAREYGYLDTVQNSLRREGITSSVFEGIGINPTNIQVDQAGLRIRETRAEFVIALGGGSVMDTAKIACAVAAGGGESWEYITEQRPIPQTVPIIAVPTLAGSGSEVASGGVINNPDVKQKRWVGSVHITPTIALWDPQTTLSAPLKVMAEGAVDMLSHVLERFITGAGTSPIADAWAVELMKCIMESSLIAVEKPDHRGARENLALASTLAITGLTNMGRNGEFTCHGFEHVLSGFHPEISHGAGLTGLIPHWLIWARDKYPNRYKALSEAYNQDFVKVITEWFRELGLDSSLEGLRVEETEIEKMNQQLWELYPERLGKSTPEETLLIWKNSLGHPV